LFRSEKLSQKDSQVDCDEKLLARQDSGCLSVSGLGAVSAESYGRDSFCGICRSLTSKGLACLLRLTTLKPIEIEGGLQESLRGHPASNTCSVGHGSSSSIRLPY
jgi:hypothetical protein